MTTRTFNLSSPAIAYLEALDKKGNQSATLDKLILEHRRLSPTIDKQEALAQMRAAIIKLTQDHNIAKAAILTWAKEASQG